jgi:5-hydroxyisourate hydrolase
MSGGLTTHVLDISRGLPASGMRIQLWSLHEGSGPVLIKIAETNADGRLEAPLLAARDLAVGEYQLVFEAGEYFASREPGREHNERFLDQIPVRFRVHEAGSPIHVPLLVAPGGYSTYRGS